MSSEKISSGSKWDRNEGRFTLYFQQNELKRILAMAEKEQVDGATFLKSICKQFVDGRLIRRETLDAYKDMFKEVITAYRNVDGVQTYGTDDPVKKAANGSEQAAS